MQFASNAGLQLYVKLQGKNLNIKVIFFISYFFSKELLTTCHCGLENLNALEKICWQEDPRIVSACPEIAERFPVNIFSCLMAKYQGKKEFWRYFWIILAFFFDFSPARSLWHGKRVNEMHELKTSARA